MNRLFWIHRLAVEVDLTLQEFVKLFQHLLLTIANRELFLVKSDRVRLAARLKEVPLVVVCSATAPTPIHQLLVVIHRHLGGANAP